MFLSAVVVASQSRPKVIDEPRLPPPEGASPPEAASPLDDIEPSERPLVLDVEEERRLLNILADLAKQGRVESTVTFVLDMIAGRIATLEERMKSDVRSGGPFADRQFRERWDRLVPDKGHVIVTKWPPELDAKLEDDILNNRPLKRARVRSTMDYSRWLKERIEADLERERLTVEFLRDIPGGVPWTSLLLVSTPDQLDEARKVSGERRVTEMALSHADIFARSSTYIDLAFVGGHGSVDRVDFLLMTVLSRGVVRTAYDLEAMEVGKGLDALQVAERDIRTLLDDGVPGGPKGNASEPRPQVPPPVEGPGQIPGLPEGEKAMAKVVTPPPGESSGPAEVVTRPPVPLTPTDPGPPPSPGAGPPQPEAKPPIGPLRLWTDVGKRTFRGRLVEVDENRRVLLEGPKGKKPEGERQWFLFDNFSEEDQELLRPYLKEDPKRGMGPAPKPRRGIQSRRRST